MKSNHPADFKAALDALLRRIEENATRQFIYNEKTNVPRGIMPPQDSIPFAIRSGVASAVNSAAEWDCQNAIDYAHDILEDANCHEHARALRGVDDCPPEPIQTPGEYVGACPSCGNVDGMGGTIRLEQSGDVRCDCCGLIAGGV